MNEIKDTPLVLVFYLDKALLSNIQIAKPFVDSVNDIIAIKKINAVAFFMPTEGEERIECINPVLLNKEENEKVTKLINDINVLFGVGDNMNQIKEND